MPAAAALHAATTAIVTPVLPAISFPLSRSLHNPRTIRGVGPAPRVISFWKQPWLRRRLAAQRARHWAVTHPTKVIDGVVQQREQQGEHVPCRNLITGEQTTTVCLNPDVFSVPLRRDIIWEVVRWQRACRRAGTHKTKDRSEVFGSGKKMRPQKGSGRARVGDMHAPHHKGGGNPFPKRPSNYSYALPPQTQALGKRVALSAKLKEGNLFVIDAPTLPTHSGEDFMKSMMANKWGSFLMIHLEGELDPNLALACRSNPNYEFLSDREVNVYDIIKHQRLVLTKKALKSIEWRLQKKNTIGNTEKTLRFMVGSFGGGYTREQVDFVKPSQPESARAVPDVDVDGLKLVVKSGKPFVTPIHWP